MFLIFGLEGKIRDGGGISGTVCPICGKTSNMHLVVKYMTPTVFFISTFPLRRKYIVTCGTCAGVMELCRVKGRRIIKGESAEIYPEDLEILKTDRSV